MSLKSDQNSDPDQSVGRLPQFMPFSRGHSDISNRGDNCSYHQPTITSDFRKKVDFLHSLALKRFRSVNLTAVAYLPTDMLDLKF